MLQITFALPVHLSRICPTKVGYFAVDCRPYRPIVAVGASENDKSEVRTKVGVTDPLAWCVGLLHSADFFCLMSVTQ